MTKIGVFPASGGLGSSIVEHLQSLIPASDLILIARNPSKLSKAKEAGATVRQADYDDHSSLENAFEGVGILMLISYASFEIDHRVQAHRHAIDTAIKSGVKHIFYSSLGFAGTTDKSIAHVMGAHLATEKYLSTKPEITYTIIREGIYSESFPIYTAWFDPQNTNPVSGDEITIPHSGRGPGVAWVKRDELGEASAKLVASYTQDPAAFKYRNKMVLLSGQRVFSLAETVEILGRATGRDLRIREISVDEYAALEHGGKHTYHGGVGYGLGAIQAGETAVVSSAIVEILGREPERYEDTIQALIESSGR
ncbi:hypothetical protein N7454_001456 [Penicillium verhagenii]|nr:hypothetical protein N7454_001456 [Penicillium verhagenii]